MVNWVSSCLSFLPETTSTVVTYIFTAPKLYNYYKLVVSNPPCIKCWIWISAAFSYWDLLKFLYFADTTERVYPQRAEVISTLLACWQLIVSKNTNSFFFFFPFFFSFFFLYKCETILPTYYPHMLYSLDYLFIYLFISLQCPEFIEFWKINFQTYLFSLIGVFGYHNNTNEKKAGWISQGDAYHNFFSFFLFLFNIYFYLIFMFF